MNYAGTWLLLLGPLVLSTVGCSRPVRLMPPDQGPVDFFRAFRDSNGLRIAVDPYHTRERVMAAFGTDLTAGGVLPVLVVLENRTEATFLVERRQFALLDVAALPPDGAFAINPRPSVAESEGVSAATALVRFVAPWVTAPRQAALAIGSKPLAQANPLLGREAAVEEATIRAVAAGVMMVALPALIAAEHANVNRMKIQNHVLASELADRTLHPGQSMRGFVYFQSASRTPVVMQESLAIGLQAPNLSDDTNWDVVVPLMAFEGDGGR